MATAVEEFDAVIVGSGFGGSCMAYRLAEAGLRTCILERGKPYPPNSFPRSPYWMARNFWDPSEGLYGLYDIWSFRGLESIISSGLGGGSLIYANVLLRKDERWFVHEDVPTGHYLPWPVTRAELDPHYDRVERMMHVQQYPLNYPPFNKTSKTNAFIEAATRQNLDWFLPNLAVTFANPGAEPAVGEPIQEEIPNLHGRTRYTCRLTGECDFGCNYGSKNSLDYTYLSAAKHVGADIRTLAEVKSFEPTAGGYLVHYLRHNAGDGDPQAPPTSHTIHTKRLVLSGGTYGSTYLLLRNRAVFPHVSDRLGTGFCDNGDLLTLALKCADHTAQGRVPRLIDAAHGPVITASVRVAHETDTPAGREYYIQDAGYPEFVNWMIEMFDTPRNFGDWLNLARRIVGAWLFGRGKADISGAVAGLFGDSSLSANLLPLLGMGRDVPSGRMYLDDGLLQVDWSIDPSREYFDSVRATMRGLAESLGGTFVDDPLWYFSRVITVHALGGCPMGRDPSEGVVDARGRVFNYPGLYVADGSVMPGPVGANPSLTIAALSDLFADSILAEAAPGGPHV